MRQSLSRAEGQPWRDVSEEQGKCFLPEQGTPVEIDSAFSRGFRLSAWAVPQSGRPPVCRKQRRNNDVTEVRILPCERQVAKR